MLVMEKRQKLYAAGNTTKQGITFKILTDQAGQIFYISKAITWINA